jgi:hypothetical protein
MHPELGRPLKPISAEGSWTWVKIAIIVVAAVAVVVFLLVDFEAGDEAKVEKRPALDVGKLRGRPGDL